MNIPQGWSVDTQDSNVYNATVPVPLKDDDSGANKNFSIKVDNTTGKITIIDKETNIEFINYDPKLNKWDPPEDDSNASESYNQIVEEIGNDGLTKVIDNAKSGSSQIILSTSSEEDKSEISETDGYKSTLSNTGEEGDTEPPPVQVINELPDFDIEILGDPDHYDDYTYPIKMHETTLLHQDTIEFKQFRYGKLSRTGQDFGTVGSREDNFEPRNGSVILAIPTGIRDSNRVNWQDDSANAFELEAAKASLAMMDNFGAGSKAALEKAINALSDPGTQGQIKTALAGQAAGLNNALARFNGAIVNPNLELLFGGPALRDFAYTIEMTPRSNEEAQQIRNIIRFFKEGMAPRRSAKNLFLQAPNVFSIRYLYENKEDHPYINMVKKKCALRECAVDYTPQNTYMTHSADGSMIAYKMTLQFTELEPLYYEDYNGKENTMGF
tara:strand:- start:11686 stop:13008 length:1323 start_codon:yes stop_codon:yes gene_type:complete